MSKPRTGRSRDLSAYTLPLVNFVTPISENASDQPMLLHLLDRAKRSLECNRRLVPDAMHLAVGRQKHHAIRVMCKPKDRHVPT